MEEDEVIVISDDALDEEEAETEEITQRDAETQTGTSLIDTGAKTDPDETEATEDKKAEQLFKRCVQGLNKETKNVQTFVMDGKRIQTVETIHLLQEGLIYTRYTYS